MSELYCEQAGEGSPVVLVHAGEETRAGWAEEGAAYERGDFDAAAEVAVQMWAIGPRRERPEQFDRLVLDFLA